MEKLLAYLNSLTPEDQDAFAKRCGTSAGYLRKAAHIKQRVGEGICLRVGIESQGAVVAADLRPDLDWAYLLTSPAFYASDRPQAPAHPAQVATETVAAAGV